MSVRRLESKRQSQEGPWKIGGMRGWGQWYAKAKKAQNKCQGCEFVWKYLKPEKAAACGGFATLGTLCANLGAWSEVTSTAWPCCMSCQQQLGVSYRLGAESLDAIGCFLDFETLFWESVCWWRLNDRRRNFSDKLPSSRDNVQNRLVAWPTLVFIRPARQHDGQAIHHHVGIRSCLDSPLLLHLSSGLIDAPWNCTKTFRPRPCELPFQCLLHRQWWAPILPSSQLHDSHSLSWATHHLH